MTPGDSVLFPCCGSYVSLLSTGTDATPSVVASHSFLPEALAIYAFCCHTSIPGRTSALFMPFVPGSYSL